MWLRARRYAIRWARQLLDRCYQRDDWVILDTETTGLDNQAELIEIAVISSYGLPLLNTRVRPTQSIPAEAIAVHHITNAMVADAPQFPDLYPALTAVLEGRTVIVYNAQFDRRILVQTQARYHCAPLPPVRWACAMRQHARYAGQWNAERRDYHWPRLQGGDHSALGDCYATLRLLHLIAANVMTKL